MLATRQAAASGCCALARCRHTCLASAAARSCVSRLLFCGEHKRTWRFRGAATATGRSALSALKCTLPTLVQNLNLVCGQAHQQPPRRTSVPMYTLHSRRLASSAASFGRSPSPYCPTLHGQLRARLLRRGGDRELTHRAACGALSPQQPPCRVWWPAHLTASASTSSSPSATAAHTICTMRRRHTNNLRRLPAGEIAHTYDPPGVTIMQLKPPLAIRRLSPHKAHPNPFRVPMRCRTGAQPLSGCSCPPSTPPGCGDASP